MRGDAHVRFGGAGRGNGPTERRVPRSGPIPTTRNRIWTTAWVGSRGHGPGAVPTHRPDGWTSALMATVTPPSPRVRIEIPPLPDVPHEEPDASVRGEAARGQRVSMTCAFERRPRLLIPSRVELHRSPLPLSSPGWAVRAPAQTPHQAEDASRGPAIEEPSPGHPRSTVPRLTANVAVTRIEPISSRSWPASGRAQTEGGTPWRRAGV
jgi:hypothetical protein